MQLITEKISLPQERPRLSRPRLIDLLHRSMEAFSTTLISGRTGTGKTLLATDFAHQCGQRVAWYNVDATDKEPHFFFHYLRESLRRQKPELSLGCLESISRQLSADDFEQVAESLIYELQEASAEPLLMVMDELHLIYDEPWVLPFFRRFIPLLPTHMHLLIVARSVIPVPLWRMRSKQNLLTIDEGWLAFTHEEASRLFASYGLSEKQAVEALRLSRGRASLLDDIAKQLSRGGLYTDPGSYANPSWLRLSAA